MPGCRHRHPILSTTHSDTASADTPADDDVLTYESDDGLWHPKAITPGHTAFISHADTPAAYAAKAGFFARVNAVPDAIEFHNLLGVVNSWAALQTFNAGIKLAASQQVQDSGGTGRVLPATVTPHVKLTGDVWSYGERLRISNMFAPSGNTVFEATARTTSYGAGAVVDLIKASHVGSGIGVSGMGATVRGVFGLPIVQFASGSSFGLVYGLHFMPYVRSASGSIFELVGAKVGYGINAFTGIITDARSIDVDPPSHVGSVHTIATSTGVRVGNHGNSARIIDANGVKIEDMTLNTGFRRLIEAGPATPYLRLLGGSNPAANQTNLYLKEAANLRQVQWVDPGAGGANFAGGERVMVLV